MIDSIIQCFPSPDNGLKQKAINLSNNFILSLTLSIDDFGVTYFTKGSSGLETLSTFIYADARKGGLTPELRPLFSLIFLTILVLLIIMNVRTHKQQNKTK